jgi:hypothetical protein
MTRRRLATIAALGTILVIAGCGRLTRVATINQVTQTAGAAAALVLQQHLAQQYPRAHVTCAHKLIVNVGTRTSCNVTDAGTNRTVRFTFTSTHGAIDPNSITATS